MTDAVTSGVIRETLFATDGTLHTSGLVREVLRSTGTGVGTYLVTDGLVREVLRTTAFLSTTQTRVMVMA
jgi:hypothetical protein